MTDQTSADQAAAKNSILDALINDERGFAGDGTIHTWAEEMRAAMGTLKRAYLAQRQENAELRRALIIRHCRDNQIPVGECIRLGKCCCDAGVALARKETA